jgi:hypothetical protein
MPICRPMWWGLGLVWSADIPFRLATAQKAQDPCSPGIHVLGRDGYDDVAGPGYNRIGERVRAFAFISRVL